MKENDERSSSNDLIVVVNSADEDDIQIVHTLSLNDESEDIIGGPKEDESTTEESDEVKEEGSAKIEVENKEKEESVAKENEEEAENEEGDKEDEMEHVEDNEKVDDEQPEKEDEKSDKEGNDLQIVEPWEDEPDDITTNTESKSHQSEDYDLLFVESISLNDSKDTVDNDANNTNFMSPTRYQPEENFVTTPTSPLSPKTPKAGNSDATSPCSPILDRVHVRNVLELELPSDVPNLGLVFTTAKPPFIKTIKDTSPLIEVEELKVGMKVEALTIGETQHTTFTGTELASLLKTSNDVPGRRLRLLHLTKEKEKPLSPSKRLLLPLSPKRKKKEEGKEKAEGKDWDIIKDEWMNSNVWNMFGVNKALTPNFLKSKPPNHLPQETTFPIHVKETFEKAIHEQKPKSPYLQKYNAATDGQSIRTIFRDNITIVGNCLGSGNFCEIHPVTAIKSDQKFPSLCSLVVKHVKASTTDEDEFIKAATELWMEAQYLATFSHENIIAVHALVVPSRSTMRNHSMAVVMDRIDETLHDRLGNQYAKDEENTRCERLSILQQLASALEYLHSLKLVYRDLKPDNIGILRNGKVKLIDFGLLTELEEGGYLTQRCGTLRYMAPEVCLGKYTELADVYSFAIVLWEVWYRQGEFLAKYNGSNIDHVKAILDGEREELPSLSTESEVEHLIAMGWDSNPQQRPRMAEMNRALREEVLVHSMDQP